jgi:hypothetical protein
MFFIILGRRREESRAWEKRNGDSYRYQDRVINIRNASFLIFIFEQNLCEIQYLYIDDKIRFL